MPDRALVSGVSLELEPVFFCPADGWCGSVAVVCVLPIRLASTGYRLKPDCYIMLSNALTVNVFTF